MLLMGMGSRNLTTWGGTARVLLRSPLLRLVLSPGQRSARPVIHFCLAAGRQELAAGTTRLGGVHTVCRGKTSAGRAFHGLGVAAVQKRTSCSRTTATEISAAGELLEMRH